MPSSSHYQVAEAYRGLRNLVLDTKPSDIGVVPTNPDEVWGVLMESGYANVAVSLVAIADGTVSMYFSNGGGIIGLGPHEGPKQAAKALLTHAQQFPKHAQPTKDYPLPEVGHTRFYLLAGDHVVTADAESDDLAAGRHAMSSLFRKSHELISAIRLVHEKQQAAQESSKVPR